MTHSDTKIPGTMAIPSVQQQPELCVFLEAFILRFLELLQFMLSIFLWFIEHYTSSEEDSQSSIWQNMQCNIY